MLEAATLFGFVILTAAVIYCWRVVYLRGLVLERLGEPSSFVERKARRSSLALMAAPREGLPHLSRPRHWLTWALPIPAGLVLYFVVRMPWPYCVALAVIASILISQLKSFLLARKAAKLETQLADSLDIMVGALGAGAGVAGALEAAIQETQNPLRRELEDVLGRIRFGDQPQVVFKNLASRIPLETFLLFASTLAVHWEVGGSLAPTLATVSRTIRDRIDISRRIRSNTAQSQISTLMVLGLTYFIALVVYSNGPEQMKEFLSMSIGSFFAAGSMLLQAIGILWMSYISRMKF